MQSRTIIVSEINQFRLGRGLLAGLVATVVLSGLMLMKQVMGVMPQLNPVLMISHMLRAPLALGWIMHFMIGTVIWGLLYAWLNPRLAGPQWLRGAEFATGAWLVMMIMLMPMAGAGAFALKLGMMAPLATLMLHWVYGAVLGTVYGAGGGPQAVREAVA